MSPRVLVAIKFVYVRYQNDECRGVNVFMAVPRLSDATLPRPAIAVVSDSSALLVPGALAKLHSTVSG